MVFKYYRRKLLFITAAFFLITSNVYASYIVDTGAPPNSNSGISLTADQSLAGQFTITETYIVDSVEGWFGGNLDFTITAAIYSNTGGSGSMSGGGGDWPKDELFSAQFTHDAPSVGVNAWDGAYGLSWTLDPGTYWLVFDIADGVTDTTYMPYGAPSPLAKYAYSYPSTSGWTEPGPASTMGMRINAVPVPAAVWLFGSGLLGLIGIARRKKS
jgi:hypothetical protein